MNGNSKGVDPRVLRLPPEGQLEYLETTDAYCARIEECNAGVEKLKALCLLDEAHAMLYAKGISMLADQSRGYLEEMKAEREAIIRKWLGKSKKSSEYNCKSN